MCLFVLYHRSNGVWYEWNDNSLRFTFKGLLVTFKLKRKSLAKDS